MEECKVYHLLGIEGGGLLLVFYTNSQAYQFRVVTAKGDVMGECSLYKTAKAALFEGLKWVGNGERE